MERPAPGPNCKEAGRAAVPRWGPRQAMTCWARGNPRPRAYISLGMANRVAKLAQGQKWLDRVADPLQKALKGGFEQLGDKRERVEGLLHGRPLGHPLHVMLTDVPLGAWTAAMACDVIGVFSSDEKWGFAARAALGVGLMGALGAAVAGLADWSQLSGETRRIGLAHGLLNIGGVALVAASFLRRPEGGRLFGLAGYATAIISARMGGELVYQRGVGVAQLGGVVGGGAAAELNRVA